ncbi:hypothetical protein HY374_02165 [Candidatus Berkelbacteria bacterium]|nr:hypothetical protein [Candidatus Berkelbacteria bacterium]
MPDEHDELRDLARTLRRENSWPRRVWAGVMFGIGATIGVAVILYVAVLLARQFQHLPLVGQYFGKVTPTLEKALEDKVPNVTSKTEEAPKQETNGTVSGSTKISTNYFRLTLPAGWDVKLNQTSTSNEKLKIVAETDDYSDTTGAQFTVSVLDPAVDPGTPVEALETESVTVDGVEGTFYRYTDLATGETETRYVRVDYNDLIYTLALAYRPATYTSANAVFDDILSEFTFKS